MTAPGGRKALRAIFPPAWVWIVALGFAATVSTIWDALQ